MLTAIDLLYKALDYDGYWTNSKRMKEAQPSICRKLQLDKLLDGFGIAKKNAKKESQVPDEASGGFIVQLVYFRSGSSKSMNRTEYLETLTEFQYFANGEFIADLDRAKYEDFIAQIISAVKTIFPEQAETIGNESVNLKHLFSDLYNFRLSVHHMFEYNFSMKRREAFSIEDDYGLHLRKKIMEAMNSHLSEVDEILCLLIDPEKRELQEDEIGYPAFDLATIDKEWQNELRKGRQL